MRAPWTSTLFRVNGKSAEMGWLMMAPLARPRRAQRQEGAQGGDEIAPTVDVGGGAGVGGHALDLRHGRSGERRVGEEGRSPWVPDQLKKKKRTFNCSICVVTSVLKSSVIPADTHSYEQCLSFDTIATHQHRRLLIVHTHLPHRASVC